MEIKSRLNVVDFVGEYVRLTKAGSSFKGLCPFHGEKTPSFMVSEERQSWHCFGCQKGGDIFSFLMEMEGLEFREALKVLADRAGVALPAYNAQQEKKTKSSYEVLETATKQYEAWFWGESGRSAREYIFSRGISEESARVFRLGYAPDGWDSIGSFLRSSGYGTEDIEPTGLLVQRAQEGRDKAQGNPNGEQKTENRNSTFNAKFQNSDSSAHYSPYSARSAYDRFRHRIMFPIGDVLGRTVGYSARVMPGGDEKQGKYINTPETSLYRKSKILYGIAKAKQMIKRENRAIVVEGNMDVIAMHQAGFENVVAVSGTAMTEEHIALLGRYAKRVTLFFDSDVAGKNAAYKSTLACFRGDLSVSMVSLSDGKDAAEVAQTDPDSLRRSVREARSAMEYFLEEMEKKFDIEKPEEKRAAVEALLPLISVMESDVERVDWARKIAERFETDVQAVVAALSRYTERERDGARAENHQRENVSIGQKKREDVVQAAILSRMFRLQSVWKRAIDYVRTVMHEEAKSVFLKAVLGYVAIEKGEEFGYDFDCFRSALSRNDDVCEAQKIRTLTENWNERENEEERWGETKTLFREFEKEVYKSILDDLARAMQSANAKENASVREELAKRFRDISQKMQNV